MARTLISRYLGKSNRPGKGEWTLVKGAAVMCCPLCGKLLKLRDYYVSPFGNVTPSVECTAGGCEFHEFIRLLEWKDID